MPRKPISFDLDFVFKDIFPRFTVKQFDDVTFNIKPKLQGSDYDITGMTGKIFVGVNNDMFMQTQGITVTSNNINIVLDKNMLQKNGRAYAEIELTDGSGTITSSSFIFNIDTKIGEGGQIPGEFEGFVQKYERLISEFRSQVNSSIDSCNDNVDNKLNSVDTLVNTKISDFENRFNALTTSKQQDAEVIDARGGENSLKARLDKINSQLEHKANTIDVNSKVWSMSNMGQDVKEAMTGGSVAVVGKDTILKENIVNYQVTPEKTSFISRINLFDKNNNIEYGKRISFPSDGYITDEAFFTSDFIEVEGVNYTINIANYDTVFCFNSSKTLIDKFSLNGWGMKNNTIKISDDTKYIRISALTEHIDKIMFVKGDSLPKFYCGFEDVIIKNLRQNAFEKTGLIGTYLFTGDSICEGGYPQLIANSNPNMICKNYGKGGTLIAKKEGRNDSILERVDTMQDDADFIILEGGVNDAWTSVPIGEFNPSNLTSGYISGLNEYEFTGALESLINKCQNKWVGKKIFFVIPHNVDIPNTKTYMDRIVEVCQKWSVIVIDLRKLSGFNCYNETIKTTYTNNSDGVHPNQLGYKMYYVEPITNILKQYTAHN